jgi:phosphopantothenoylcysteine synthetase/decarboxylase
MSLASQLQTLATRIGTEFKTVRSEIVALVGAKSSLTTTDKSTIVAAINEVKASISGAGAAIDDVTASTTKVYSSSKTNSAIATAVANLVNSAPGTLDTLGEIATALAADEATATALATSVGNRLRFDAAQSLTAPQQAQAQTNMNAADATAVGSTTTDFVATFTAALI